MSDDSTIDEEGKAAFSWGIDALDELLGQALIPGTSILVAGNPGAGKTTLAATICYHNARRGNPCLYVSFYEEEDRFINQMKRYGMDFGDPSLKGRFRYVKLPLILDVDALETMLETIHSYSEEIGARVIVVDSFTPMGMIVREEAKARELVQNFFYTLARMIQGIVVIIAEIPYGRQRVEIGGVEFVTDIVLILKHIVVNRLLTRILEIRKARGAPITVAELPFSIVEGRGIAVYAPPVIREIPLPRRDIVYELPCKLLKRVLGAIHPGEVIYGEYPADARVRQLLLPFTFGFIYKNKLKTLIISYRRSPQEIVEGIKSLLHLSDDDPCTQKLLDLIDVVALNPSAMSVEESYATEIETIRRKRPQLVLFERIDIPARMHRSSELFFKYLHDQLLVLRGLGVITIRASAYIDKEHYIKNSSISDIVFKMFRIIHGDRVDLKLYVWRYGAKPQIVSEKDIEECTQEILSMIKADCAESA
ncbi:RAD55 family ATPase [Pyrofollis japonicus]|uniref:RAD55 family ATPase n=1 Tax=Pyrofollis japonicus TaxID=3060460 RepID=UPI00295BC0CE|nr:ATPase domain-containing protein [Pyrofollis japonicus]